MTIPENLKAFLYERSKTAEWEKNPPLVWDPDGGFLREWGNWPCIWAGVPYTPEQRAAAEAASWAKWEALLNFPVRPDESEVQFCARAKAAGF